MAVTITLVKDYEDGAIPARGVSVEDFAEHGLHDFLVDRGFEAKVGHSHVVPAEDGRPVILLGLGDDERTVADFRTIGATLARAATKLEKVVTDVLDAVGELNPADAARAFAEGVGLGTYTYTTFKSDPEPSLLTAVDVVGKGGKRVQTAFDVGLGVAAAVNEARDLVNEPGGSLTPPAYADKIRALGKTYGFDVKVLSKAGIEKAKMGGLLGVNRGSEQEPRFVELTWTPEGKAKGAVALVGKGITFDSGGLSLKPSDGMLTMKCDMGGSAAVVGAFCGLGATRPKVEVRGYVPITDNMTGGDATRLGDVLTISNGKTVEIHNTDAEGRLILADGLSKASAAAPDAIVDLATLTGACMVALGNDRAGIFGNSQPWIDQVLAAGEEADEKSWPLPLPKEWRSQLDSDIADMKNIGTRMGGASTAALFLQEFVGTDGTDIPWVHVDLAGPAFADTATALHPKGGTGYGVRSLLALLDGFRKPG